MSCPACGSEKVSVDFGERGKVFACLACEHHWTTAQIEAASVAQQAKREPAQVATAAQPLAPKNILVQARAELRRLNVEIKRLERLKRQRDEIKRLLAAAKTKQPRAVVRQLRSQAQG